MKKKKKVCKHLWQFIPLSDRLFSTYEGEENYEALAICQKCLEKRYV